MLTKQDVSFSRNWPLHVMFSIYFAYFVITAISPTHRMQWLMESILPVAVILVLAFTYQVFKFSNLSYLCMFIFLCLHTYGAHYTYQATPFDTWLKATIGTQRSYYDRVVHFAFGLFWAYPFRELLTRVAIKLGFWSYAITTVVVLGISAFFEIVEMGAAYAVEKYGEEYVGMQGDVFDSHKDMGLALAGAIVTLGILAYVIRRINSEKFKLDEG
ncbi:DUF2238 domain-containing protein [Paenibacillus qinlingensis]|uniref:Membrane protein n=1 Tax=Paenibacillus qinlingensis TaxID=1837343 RepID=A0ABU1NRL2_9BACL|nr:DUF2238 domain-containing protein [Paenibacillus qinlingensis]MDR6549994.1 putative membrane protein [Paenibacillus qinlingensis]